MHPKSEINSMVQNQKKNYYDIIKKLVESFPTVSGRDLMVKKLPSNQRLYFFPNFLRLGNAFYFPRKVMRHATC